MTDGPSGYDERYRPFDGLRRYDRCTSIAAVHLSMTTVQSNHKAHFTAGQKTATCTPLCASAIVRQKHLVT